MRFVAHEYQERMIDKVVDMEHVGLFLDMGLG
jgi:hypothetical protein